MVVLGWWDVSKWGECIEFETEDNAKTRYMAFVGWVYWISKHIEFCDTVCIN